MKITVLPKFLDRRYNRQQLARLELAINEAKRFLLAAGAMQRSWQTAEHVEPSTRYTATVKRASMDLTHALADVRRSPYPKTPS